LTQAPPADWSPRTPETPAEPELPRAVALAWGVAANPQRGPKREMSIERIVDAAIGIAEADEDEDDEDTFDLDSGAVTSEDRTAKADDVGELYGVHLPPAQDRERGSGPEHGEYAESELGENWLETLGGETAEGGPVPEHEVDPNDDSDYRGGHHATESGDRPVADKGSGGPGGL
jgi:hypothetical protein